MEAVDFKAEELGKEVRHETLILCDKIWLQLSVTEEEFRACPREIPINAHLN
ncbi:hypothetical protein DBW_2500 [Desulfuromonas sp. DDH964]|nr:hypothetical protein DBW_2499 [Desulfuromonas sp. DDH964]AMV72830.1 hypothetical protein DBW_2500 [Desulfuromonas sp. DDH964]